MYVRKFDGDSLDEVLKQVKRELGPEAIILKTMTNSGIKGAFKKKKIEITAAVKEEDYLKKAHLDHVLTDDDKSKMYQNPASNINQTINEYNQKKQTQISTPAKVSSYDKMGLNKPVQARKSIGRDLDQFLANDNESTNSNIDQNYDGSFINNFHGSEQVEVSQPQRTMNITTSPALNASNPGEFSLLSDKQVELERENHQLKSELAVHQAKIDELVSSIELIKDSLNNRDDFSLENHLVRTLKNTLRVLDINEKIIRTIVQDISFLITDSRELDEDEVYELAISKLQEIIQTDQLKKVNDELPMVVLCSSELSCGQTSFAIKLSKNLKNSKIIKFTSSNDANEARLACHLLGIEEITVNSIELLITEVRKAYEQNNNIIIDFNIRKNSEDDFIYLNNTLKKSFVNFTSSLCISLVHEELYNQSIMKKYSTYIDGIVLTHLDMTLNLGSLFNLQFNFSDKPIYFISEGNEIPNGLIKAKAEKIIDKLLN